MKKLNIYILAFAMFLVSSCGDYLDVEPITDLTEQNFYQTPNDAYTALVGCYDGLQVVYNRGVALPVAVTIFSDNCFGGTGNSDNYDYQLLDEFDNSRSPNQNIFDDTWIAYYAAVYRCNTLLQYMEQIDWKNNEDLRVQYEAEARFIRAYLYFDMVRLWGHIPLLLAPSTENIPQSSPDEVYKAIADDLKFAADNLDAISYPAQADEEFGRVTKYAAEALIGRVYLFYTGYYKKTDLAGVITKAEALAYLEDVIQNGGYSLLENFSELWPAASLDQYAGEHNQETIFSIRYTYTSDYNGNTDGNHWKVMLGIREQSVYPYGQGWGAATVTPEFWNTYDENDTRREASIISIKDEGINFEKLKNQREYTGYYVKKYSPMSNKDGSSVVEGLGQGLFQISQFQDFVAIRYADVLLMAAELGSPNAQSYFDEVRRRAYQDDFTTLTVTKDNIIEERRLELAFEGIRYWDLLRQGVNYAAQKLATSTTVLNGGKETKKVINQSEILETQGLQQIPNTQITLSGGVLKQNTGW
ncbi:RagB/SusD family nutrient uptake outer membrane protein [Fulvivirga sediminis]|uniref:RagB/SusD family nutrient uptake outer membrane protein n=1 Tax=Fulvivirga sediminis TaxID=2803949 RepID=A0A937JZU5_9BACT|nr:RagB/SusD family nutrient uptake outer membrane protein [Fulvivirga sediminis]MBL3655601.1 RagB/SusD family nutrient uptake outer membrane protein [Fulvivirga sediminis]